MSKRRFLIGLGLLVAFRGPAAANILGIGACQQATLAHYISLGSTGCEIDHPVFKDFRFQVLDFGGGATPITAADILVTPSLTGSAHNLSFSSPGFQVTGNQFVVYLISYFVDPDPRIITFSDELETETPVFPGRVDITTDLCIGRAFRGAQCLRPGTPAQLSLFHDGMQFQTFDSVAFRPTADVGVRNTIALRANGASADFRSLTNRTIVPEPATWLLLGSGVLGMRFWRRRLSR